MRKGTAVDGFRYAFPDLPVGSNLRRETAELVMGYIELVHEARKSCIQLTVENSEPIRRHVAAGEGVGQRITTDRRIRVSQVTGRKHNITGRNKGP